MTDSTEFTTIPDAGNEFRGEMDTLKRNLPILAELGPEIARMRWKLYEAHIQAGFNETQALELCKSIML